MNYECQWCGTRQKMGKITECSFGNLWGAYDTPSGYAPSKLIIKKYIGGTKYLCMCFRCHAFTNFCNLTDARYWRSRAAQGVTE